MPVSSVTHYHEELLSSCLNDLPSFDSQPLYGPTSDEAPVKYVQPPNPEWGFGDGVESTELGRKWMEGIDSGWEHYDMDQTDIKKTSSLLLGGIQPRPIAFISSVSTDGVENLAPFSFFQVLIPTPPLIMICATNVNADRVKDTAANILATKEFTVNIVSLPWIEQANVAAIDTPDVVSEWELTGLTREPSTHIRAPRVKESAFSIECTYFNQFDIDYPESPAGTPLGQVIFGRVKCIHVRKDVLDSRGAPDPAKLMAVSRMGDISYGLTSHAFRLPRPSWKKDGVEIQKALEKKTEEKRKSESSV